jgi:large subunit ribosomal protein L25
MATTETLELAAEPRDGNGRSAARRLRREERVPGVVYGAGQPPVSVSLSARALGKAMAAGGLTSQIFTLRVGDQPQQVIVRELQRHPATEAAVHVDFLRVRQDRALVVRVPLRFVNEDRCVGVRQGGGQISHHLTEVEISALPKDLPREIEVDVAALQLGDGLHLSELTLPAGVRIPALEHGDDHDELVVNVHQVHATEEAAPAADAAAAATSAAPAAKPEG